MPEIPTPSPQSEPEALSADLRGSGPAPPHRLRRPSLAEFLSGVAIVATVVIFLVGLHAQKRQDTALGQQNDRGQLLQLRSEYARITSLVEHPPPSGLELETALAVATGLLHSLSREANGADFLFIGDAYRMDHHPELSVPLYKEALARLAQPTDRITAFRGLGYADALIEEPKDANAAMSQAVTVSEHSGYPQIAKYNNEASTQRVWVTVAATLHECVAARQHAQQYLAVLKHLPEPNWGPGPGDVQQVRTAAKTCR